MFPSSYHGPASIGSCRSILVALALFGVSCTKTPTATEEKKLQQLFSFQFLHEFQNDPKKALLSPKTVHAQERSSFYLEPKSNKRLQTDTFGFLHSFDLFPFFSLYGR